MGLRGDEVGTSGPGIAGTQPSNALWLALEEKTLSQPLPLVGTKTKSGFLQLFCIFLVFISESLRFSLFSVPHLIVSHGASLPHENSSSYKIPDPSASV